MGHPEALKQSHKTDPKLFLQRRPESLAAILDRPFATVFDHKQITLEMFPSIGIYYFSLFWGDSRQGPGKFYLFSQFQVLVPKVSIHNNLPMVEVDEQQENSNFIHNAIVIGQIELRVSR